MATLIKQKNKLTQPKYCIPICFSTQVVSHQHSIASVVPERVHRKQMGTTHKLYISSHSRQVRKYKPIDKIDKSASTIIISLKETHTVLKLK